jgi:hypothetical protein
MIARLIIGALILGSVALMAFELNRWRDPSYRDGLSGAQEARRIFGSLLLLIVLSMAYVGTYFPGGHITTYQASLEMLYWLFCLLLAVFLPAIAYIEAKVSLIKFAHERREAKTQAAEGMEDLIRRAVLNTPAEKKPPAQ